MMLQYHDFWDKFNKAYNELPRLGYFINELPHLYGNTITKFKFS